MNEGGCIFIYLLQIYNKFAGVMLGVGHNFGTEECNDMIGYNISRLVRKVGIVYAKVGVKPVDLSWDEFAGNEALE